MYDNSIQLGQTILQQGDIIDDFPFYLLEKGVSIIKTEAGGFEVGEDSSLSNSLVAMEKKNQKVMILSQTCDVQRRSNVIICPVYDLSSFTADNTLNVNRVEAIRKRGINYWFYLPEQGPLLESIGDFQTMIYVPRELIESYFSKKVLSLSDLGRHHLAWALATFFGRPAGE